MLQVNLGITIIKYSTDINLRFVKDYIKKEDHF